MYAQQPYSWVDCAFVEMHVKLGCYSCTCLNGQGYTGEAVEYFGMVWYMSWKPIYASTASWLCVYSTAQSYVASQHFRCKVEESCVNLHTAHRLSSRYTHGTFWATSTRHFSGSRHICSEKTQFGTSTHEHIHKCALTRPWGTRDCHYVKIDQ